MDKQLVSTFMEVTACESQAKAVRHLGSCHWNLDEAINLYFSNDGGSTEPPSGSSADPIILPEEDVPTEEDKDHGDATVDGDYEDNVGAPLYYGDRSIAVDAPFIVEMPKNELVTTGWGEDDAGEVRVENVDGKKQEAHEDEDAEQDDNISTKEDDGGSTKEDDGGSMHGSDGEGYGAYNDEDYEYGNMGYSDEEEDDDDAYYASISEDPDGDRPAVQPPPQKESLEDLFMLPRNLMYRGSFHFAKMDAASKDRFLLVNLQISAGAGAGDFPSQMQNRDLWADDLVKQVIEDSFVFFLLQKQKSHDSHFDQCMKVASFYKVDVDQLPAVLVLDPITGQLLAKRSGTMMPGEFMQFVDVYTKSNPSTISKPKFVEKTPPVLPNAGGEQEWAWGSATVEQKPAAVSESPAVPADDEVSEQEQEIPMSYAAAVVGGCSEQEPVPVPNNTTDELPADMVDDDDDDEPMEDEEMYKLRIRFPDGTRITKEFGCKRRVASLFAFCRSALHGGEQHAKEEKKAIRIMRFAGRASVVIQEDDAGATFEDLGLNFSAVSVVFDAV